ncbi:hypothetical protein [Jiangella asiatica]|uniref:DUF4333 domain-containing protein n=1 Tax=Jiangella asiatica TaxID=2530372 RepID=A0A4R5DF47_9ACTN|nr:hypothetical protein [Jiangella asiatica]TDE09255.1 hypothetical protein E1269_14615 [Jiangella asiatica]
MQRTRRVPALLAAGILSGALVLSGCSEQLDQGLNDLAASALEDAVNQQLADAGITLEEGPDCSTDLTRDGNALTGDANCDAVAVDGRPVRAEFDGTLSSSGCSGSLAVYHDDTAVAQVDEIPDCSVSL